MWKHSKKQSLSQHQSMSFFRTLLSLFAGNTRGASGIMMTVLFFISLLFVGVAVDYDRYTAGKAQMDSALREANSAAGITCKKMLEENALTPGTHSEEHIEDIVRETFLTRFSNSALGFIGGARLRENTTPKIDVIFETTPKKVCRVASSYEGEVATLIARFVGHAKFYFGNRASGAASISSNTPGGSTIIPGSGGPVQIDFLLDVSGSMSTVAQSDQRDLMMAITMDPQISHGPMDLGGSSNNDREDGCVFACHSRSALMNKVPSQNIIDVMNGKTVFLDIGRQKNKPVESGSGWTTGDVSRQFKLSPPTQPGPTPKIYTGADMPGSYIAYGDALAYMGVKLKTDIMASAMLTAIQTLKKGGGQQKSVDVAFHRFSNYRGLKPLNTVLPLPPAQYIKIENVPNDEKTLKNYFDYLVTCGQANFWGQRHGKVYAPETGDRPVTDAKNCTPDIDGTAHTYIEEALRDIKKKLEKAPESDVAKVVVLITDGIETGANVQTEGSRRINANVCKELTGLPERKKPTLIIIHTYYRLQQNNSSVQRLVERVLGNQKGTALNILPFNSNFNAEVNKIEKEFNEAVAVPLKECAGDKYYKADDENGIKDAFNNMAQAIDELIITTPGTTNPGSGWIED